MPHRTTRRDFLRHASTTGAVLGVGGLAFLDRLPPVSAADAQVDPKLVRLDSGIEPLVRVIEETPRDKLLEEMGARIQKGQSYRETLTALFLAGIRSIRPESGNNFHAVLAVFAAHQASLASPNPERWLPIFWALDSFKAAQTANGEKDKGWRMEPVKEEKLPPRRKARANFLEAADQWNEEAGELAMIQLVRSCGAGEVFDLVAGRGARNFLGLGHDAIYLANCWRTLQCIGWQHAEPVLRSMSLAWLRKNNHPPTEELARTHYQVWQGNRELAAALPEDWADGKPDSAATADLLAGLREAAPADASKKVFDLLKKGVAPQSIWDAVFVGVGELQMRWPGPPDKWPGGVLPLHAATSLNAVYFAYTTTSSDETRRLLLLQSGAIVPFFLDSGRRRANWVKPAEGKLDQLEALPLKPSGPEALADVFADASKNRTQAVRKTLSYLSDGAGAQSLIDAARLLVFFKGSDAHDYKFSSAVFEDYERVSPTWRNRYLASSMYILRGSGEKDNGLVQRTREALKG